MKGDSKVNRGSNSLLADEITAVNQHMVHSEMCAALGLCRRLHETIEKRAIQEMKHAESLIGRILFLEGRPIVSELKKISIGSEVPQMMEFDHKAEFDAIKSYNAAIKLAGSWRLCYQGIAGKILQDEDAHIDEIEEIMDQDQADDSACLPDDSD